MTKSNTKFIVKPWERPWRIYLICTYMATTALVRHTSHTLPRSKTIFVDQSPGRIRDTPSSASPWLVGRRCCLWATAVEKITRRCLKSFLTLVWTGKDSFFKTEWNHRTSVCGEIVTCSGKDFIGLLFSFARLLCQMSTWRDSDHLWCPWWLSNKMAIVRKLCSFRVKQRHQISKPKLTVVKWR